MQERRKYQLRATIRPAKNPLVSSTVLVRNEQGEAGYCYANFSKDFVDRVGSVLPRGVSVEDPACLSVRYYPRTKVWLVVAQYVDGSEERLLWKTEAKPSWLNFYRVKHHGGSKTESDSDSGVRTDPHGASEAGARTSIQAGRGGGDPGRTPRRATPKGGGRT